MTHKNSPSALTPVPASAESLLNLRIKHTRIKQVINELNTLIYPGSQDSILLVIGPTGAGKTTLARYMVEQAVEGATPEMNTDAGLIPAVYVEAPSSGEDDFSWRLFYTQALAELGEDLSAPKVAYGIDATTGKMVRPRGISPGGLAGLRTAVERCLKERDTRFVVIDEAAHIIRQTRRSRLEIQLDTLKSLANKGRSQIVMVGSYDLYQLVSLSGQLARRIHVVHCERCGKDNIRHTAAYVVPGWCTHCGEFLGKAGEMPATASIDPAARWAARQIGELVHAQQTLASTPTRDNLINAISQIIEEMDNGQSALFARRIGVAKSTVHNWLKGDGTPTLKASLKIAAHSGASLTQLLSGDLSTWVCPQIEPQLVLNLPQPKPRTRTVKRERNWAEIENQLQAFLVLPTPITVREAGNGTLNQRPA